MQVDESVPMVGDSVPDGVLFVCSFSFALSSSLIGGLLLSDGRSALSVSQDEGVAPDVCAAPHLLADLLRFDYRVVRKLRHPIFD